jgi:hypothetical protein
MEEAPSRLVYKHKSKVVLWTSLRITELLQPEKVAALLLPGANLILVVIHHR